MAMDANDAKDREETPSQSADQPPIDDTAADRTTGATGADDANERVSPPSTAVPAEARADGVVTPDQPRDAGPKPLP